MNNMNDIIPPGGEPMVPPRKSIRDIPITKRPNKIDELLSETADFRSTHHAQPQTSEVPPPYQDDDNFTPPKPPMRKAPKSPSSPRKALWLIALIAILVLAGASLMFFRSANVNVTLNIVSIPVDVTATSSADIASSSSSTLPYKVIPIQKEGTLDVASTGATKQVDTKASGTIIIYNNYSSASQDLIATTRFETSSGLVYRINKTVTVPGTTVVAGKTIPGSVTAVVYADASGDKYNGDKTDFTIPGFQGTPKYSGFYARSETALTGGYSGMMAQVSDADLKQANANLQQSLMDEAVTGINSQKPANYLFFKDGVRTTYTSTVTPGSAGKATVKGTLSVEALVFDADAVTSLINTSLGKQYNFDDLTVLTLSFSPNTTSFISSPTLNIELKGTLTSGNSFNADDLKRTLAGKSKQQLPEILKLYPEIIKADAVLHPFWSSSFPSNENKITITVTK
jgi:hypothetical protein